MKVTGSVVVGVLSLIGLLTGCAADSSADDPISQAEIAFEGSPPRDEIRHELDRALKLYGLPATDENYSRAGSSLVALRKETGVPEMEILRAAIRLHTPGVNLSLPDAFGLAATELKVTGGQP